MLWFVATWKVYYFENCELNFLLLDPVPVLRKLVVLLVAFSKCYGVQWRVLDAFGNFQTLVCQGWCYKL